MDYPSSAQLDLFDSDAELSAIGHHAPSVRRLVRPKPHDGHVVTSRTLLRP